MNCPGYSGRGLVERLPSRLKESMRKCSFTDGQIAEIPRGAGQGLVAAVAKKHEVSEQMIYT